MSRSLFTISEDFLALDALLEELNGDISDPKVATAVDAWFTELDKDLNKKADNYAAFVTELLARAKARKEEADRLSHRAEMDTNTAKWLKDRLKGVLQERGIKKLDTDRFVISVCVNGGKQPLTMPENIDDLPVSFCKVILEPDVDLIRNTLSAGDAVPGCSLGERGTHLRIG